MCRIPYVVRYNLDRDVHILLEMVLVGLLLVLVLEHLKRASLPYIHDEL